MEVEPRAALVVEGPAHEGGAHLLQHRHLLDRRLEAEGPVGRVQGGTVAEVDLVLRVHELVVRGVGTQAHPGAGVEHPARDAARVALGADGVDPRQRVDVADGAFRRAVVRFEQEELELRAHDRAEPKLGQSVRGPPHRAARVERMGVALLVDQVDQAGRDVRRPGQHRGGREVGPGEEVRVADLAAHHRRMGEVGRHDRRAEGDPVLDLVAGVGKHQVLAAGDAVEIGVHHPQRPGALLRQPFHVAHVRPLLTSRLPRPRPLIRR